MSYLRTDISGVRTPVLTKRCCFILYSFRFHSPSIHSCRYVLYLTCVYEWIATNLFHFLGTQFHTVIRIQNWLLWCLLLALSQRVTKPGPARSGPAHGGPRAARPVQGSSADTFQIRTMSKCRWCKSATDKELKKRQTSGHEYALLVVLCMRYWHIRHKRRTDSSRR